MTSERIQTFLKEHVPKYFSGDRYVKPIYLSMCITRAATQVWRETEGEPVSIRRAKFFSRYLDQVPIFIRPFELIVGYHSEDSHAMPFDCFAFDTKIAESYIQEGYVKPNEVDEWKEHLEYWKTRNLKALMTGYLGEELKQAKTWRYMEVLPTEYSSRTQPDHETYLRFGLDEILKMLNEKLERLRNEWDKCKGGSEAVELRLKIADVQAMTVACQAVIRWARRYSKLAKELAEKETNPARKAELFKISEICDWVPANPPRSFHEALQSHWFCFLAYQCMELLCHGTSLRLDEVFWPWYERDVVIEKTLPREKAVELIEELMLHVDELGRPLPLWARRQLQGVNYLATYTIGGVKPEDGSDSCNELTLAILDALDDARIQHPDFKFRWHPKVDPRVFRRVLEVIRSGLGQPSIKNDSVAIEYLMNHYGFTLEEARSWAVVGCVSPAPSIHWGRSRRDAWSVYPAKCLEFAMFNGEDPTLEVGAEERKYLELTTTGGLEQLRMGIETGDAKEFNTFNELLEAFRKQFANVMRKSARIKTIGEYCNSMLCKRPFSSCLFWRSLENCRDIIDVPEKGMPWVNDSTVVDTVDSLISLKNLVFDEKKYRMQDVLKALRANWDGYEDMRTDFIRAPKFGNNEPYADEVAVIVYSMIAEEMAKVYDINNASPMPSGLVITDMYMLAPIIGALPNGRKLGDPLADGGISPHAGYDRNGPLAAVLSASKIDARKQKANVFNQTLTPASIDGDEGLKKFEQYVRTAMLLGLDMIQFSVVDSATLQDAQRHPEKYPTLTVRVSGYNARFIDLGKFVQDAFIQRTENRL